MAKKSKRMARRAQQQAQQQRYIYGGVALVVVALVGIVAYMMLTVPPEVSAERLEQEVVLGASNAPVELVEYGAYGCHSCREVHQSGILDQIMQQYEGEVRFIFRNWPVINPRIDPIAAEAVQCALDQGEDAYWTLHNAIFDVSLSTYEQMTNAEQYADLATESGLDGEALQVCLDEDTHQRTVDHWREHGDSRGLRGTPSFFVNGQPVASANQLPTFIERALGG